MAFALQPSDLNTHMAGMASAVTKAVTKELEKRMPTIPTPGEGHNTDKGNDARSNEKSYKRIEKFSGGESEWDDWKYDFMVIARSVNADVGKALERCIKNKKPVTAKELHEDAEETRFTRRFRETAESD